MTDRVRSKWEKEIANDISAIREAATQATLTEVLFLLTLMHNMRLLSYEPHAPAGENPRVLQHVVSQTQEAIRYAVSMILKFGKSRIRTDKQSRRFLLDHGLVVRILNTTKILNSKYEMGALVGLAEAHPFGERDRYVELDFRSVAADPVARGLWAYFARTELSGELARTTRPKGLAEFVNGYLERFGPVADLIPPVFGVELETIARFVLHVGDEFRRRTAAAAAAMGVRDDGDIVPVNTVEWFQRYSQTLLFPVDALREALGEDVLRLIDRLTFPAEDFDEANLQVHALWRAPLIRVGPLLVVCPEFLLDSLHPNTHYSLLEAETVKAEYMARAARIFVDRVATVAAQLGWIERAREVFVRKGKRDLGDLDLVLEKDGEVLAIEAKGHVLPLPVYFHDAEATRRHLERSQQAIEAKVQARIDYLRDHHADYGLPADFRYIVVTQSPEVLSHFSALLVLSLEEFAAWLGQTPLLATFEQVSEEVYGHLAPLTADDLKTLLDEGILAFDARPPPDGAGSSG